MIPSFISLERRRRLFPVGPAPPTPAERRRRHRRGVCAFKRGACGSAEACLLSRVTVRRAPRPLPGGRRVRERDGATSRTSRLPCRGCVASPTTLADPDLDQREPMPRGRRRRGGFREAEGGRGPVEAAMHGQRRVSPQPESRALREAGLVDGSGSRSGRSSSAAAARSFPRTPRRAEAGAGPDPVLRRVQHAAAGPGRGPLIPDRWSATEPRSPGVPQCSPRHTLLGERLVAPCGAQRWRAG